MMLMNANRAFRRGFSDGFTSPFRVFSNHRKALTYSHRYTDAAAWREVGSLINQAYHEVGADLGKNTGKATATTTTGSKPREREHAKP